MNKLYLLLFIIFIHLPLFGQNKAKVHYAYKKYTVYDGLLGRDVNYLFQDSRGYLWLRDSRYFYRFDGKTIENSGLDNNDFATVLFEDGGRIFARRMLNQIIQIDQDLHFKDHPRLVDATFLYTFTCWSPLVSHSFLTHLSKIVKSPETRILFIKKVNGVKYYFYQKKVMYIDNQQAFSNKFHHIYQYFVSSKNNAFTYGYDSVLNQVVSLQFSKGIFTETPISKKKIVFPGITQFSVDNQGRILYCSAVDSMLYCMEKGEDFSTGIKSIVLKGTIPTTGYLNDNEEDHWVGCEGGLYNFFDLQFREFIFGDQSIKEYNQSISQDHLGNTWYNSLKTGLCLLNPDGSYKTVKSGNGGTHACLGCYTIGKIMFTLYSDYIQIKEDNSIQKIKVNVPYLGTIVKDVTFDRYLVDYYKNNKPAGVFVLKKTSKGRWTLKRTVWRNNAIMGISCGEDGSVFVSGLKGEGYLIGDSLVEADYLYPYRRVLSSCYDYRGNLWKGTTDGLYLFTNPLSIYFNPLTNPKYSMIHHFRVASSQILSIVQSVQVYNNLLFACSDTKLFVLDLNKYYSEKQERCFEFNRSNGYNVDGEQANGLYVDKDRFLWIMSPYKLIRVPVDYIGSVIDQTTKNEPFIKQILVSENNLDWIDLTDTLHDISVGSSFNTLQFSFQTNSMKFPNNIVYRYKLTGYDDNWSNAATGNKITYANLHYGKYRFIVQSSINGVKWSNPTFSEYITIRIAWWQRPVVVVMAVILSVFLIALITRTVYLRRYRMRDQERKLAQIQLQAIKAKSIPHFTGNALMSITALFYRNDTAGATEYLNIFNRFVNQILHHADEAERPLKTELDFANQYLNLEKLRFRDKVNFRFDISPEVDQSILLPAMILHTWCENAIKHGIKEKKGNGEVLVSARKNGNKYLIFVEDNGIGRIAAEALHTRGNGKGLSIVEQQVTLLNKGRKQKMQIIVDDLTDANGQSSGTRFTLVINL